MINAVLYSDQVIPANERIDRFLLEMLEGRGNRIGYVPSGPDPDGRFWPAGRPITRAMAFGCPSPMT